MKINSPGIGSGRTLSVFRSNNANIWTLSSPAPTCTVDASMMCTFATDHLSYFGFVSVTSTPITPAPVTTTTTIGGGGGGGSSTYTPMASISLFSTQSQSQSPANLLVPSIARLLEGKNATAPKANKTLKSNQKVIKNPITPYVCSVIEQVQPNVYNSALEGEFAQDVQSLLAYRAVENADNYLSDSFLKSLKYGIASSNGDFRGSESVTRAEFIKMLVRSLACNYQFMGNRSGFSDVDADMWYSEYITFANKKGWINGYTDGTFHPNAPITRAEASKILAQAIQLEVDTEDMESFYDVDASHEFAPYIYTLRSQGVINGKTNNYFDMNSNISRNEVARIINKTFLSVE
jgi:hypothetical protein